MKRTVTLGDFLGPHFSVSGCSRCNESCEWWRGVKRKNASFGKEFFKHFQSLCCENTGVFTNCASLLGASICLSPSVCFPIYISLYVVSSLCPPESCSDTLYAAYPAFVPSKMHTFDSEGMVLCRYCYKD